MPEIEKRTVVVTGGSRGIGRAICTAFSEPGANIFFNYYNPANPEAEAEAAAETETIITNAGAKAKSFSVDVADEDSVTAFFDAIVKETGRVDVLINNAGITRDGLLVRMKTKDWDAVLDINLKGAFTCIKLAAKAMMKQRYGRIINLASIAGVIGNASQVNYAASKAGLIGVTKTAAKELASRNITVNAVAPGFIETDMTAVLPEKVKENWLSQIPLGRAGKPEDVASVVAFLASEKADYITGQVIHVSGGMYI